MGERIIICGPNGAGKSTLGRALSAKLGHTFKDIEDYYFPERDTDYPYAHSRTKDEVAALLLEDLKRYNYFLVASVTGDYGEEIVSMFTRAVFISVPKEIRMKRVRDRSYMKFGDRILPGGDLYDQEKSFFEMVDRRPERFASEWLEATGIPTITVDGTKSVEDNVILIARELENL